MNTHHHEVLEKKKKFQLERIILFSDAVFAIAITLLIIEIKVPHFEGEVTGKELAHALWEKTPEFLAFLVSFLVIGQFWTSHHRLFAYVEHYTSGLLWLNMFMLLWVVLMPFSTFLIMQYGNLDIGWFWYSANLALIGFSIYLIWRYIGNKPELCSMANDKAFLKMAYSRAMLTTLIFVVSALLTLLPWGFFKGASRILFVFIFPGIKLIERKYKRKL